MKHEIAPTPTFEDPRFRSCVRCLFNETVPGIEFGVNGQCSFCDLHDQMNDQYPIGKAGEARLKQIVAEMKAAGTGKEFDCVVGVSGGCDSSKLVHELVTRGLRPLAFHFDNTWNSSIATNNIYTVLDQLNVPLETYVADNHEYDDLTRSIFEAGVPEIDGPTDLALTTVGYQTAIRHGVKYLIEGHSFRTEGVSPLGWIYFDGRYILNIHKQFGKQPMNRFPNLPMIQFLRWAAVSGIRRVRPLYYVDYHKERTKEFLTREYGWQWYGGHHLENRLTAFAHTYYLPQRFGLDFRFIELSGRVRSGQLSREEASSEFHDGCSYDPSLVDLVKKRLGYSESKWNELMNAPLRYYFDYPNYKRLFRLLRPVFWVLYKLNRVPRTFYVKWCT